jgi:hypothetical protein
MEDGLLSSNVPGRRRDLSMRPAAMIFDFLLGSFLCRIRQQVGAYGRTFEVLMQWREPVLDKRKLLCYNTDNC